MEEFKIGSKCIYKNSIGEYECVITGFSKSDKNNVRVRFLFNDFDHAHKGNNTDYNYDEKGNEINEYIDTTSKSYYVLRDCLVLNNFSKRYNINDLVNNNKVVVFIKSEEQFSKLEKTGLFKLTPKFYGPYCYDLTRGEYSFSSSSTSLGCYSGRELVNFYEIDFNTSIETKDDDLVYYKAKIINYGGGFSFRDIGKEVMVLHQKPVGKYVINECSHYTVYYKAIEEVNYETSGLNEHKYGKCSFSMIERVNSYDLNKETLSNTYDPDNFNIKVYNLNSSHKNCVINYLNKRFNTNLVGRMYFYGVKLGELYYEDIQMVNVPLITFEEFRDNILFKGRKQEVTNDAKSENFSYPVKDNCPSLISLISYSKEYSNVNNVNSKLQKPQLIKKVNKSKINKLIIKKVKVL